MSVSGSALLVGSVSSTSNPAARVALSVADGSRRARPGAGVPSRQSKHQRSWSPPSGGKLLSRRASRHEGQTM